MKININSLLRPYDHLTLSMLIFMTYKYSTFFDHVNRNNLLEAISMHPMMRILLKNNPQ